MSGWGYGSEMREKGSTWVEGPFSYLYPVWPPPTGQQGQSPAPQSAPLCPVTYVSLSPVSLLPSLSSFFAPSSSRPHACHVSISVPTQHRRSGLWIHLCFSFSHAMAHPLSLFLSWSISHSPHLYFSLFFMISLSFTLCVFLFSVSLSTAHQLHCYHWFFSGSVSVSHHLPFCFLIKFPPPPRENKILKLQKFIFVSKRTISLSLTQTRAIFPIYLKFHRVIRNTLIECPLCVKCYIYKLDTYFWKSKLPSGTRDNKNNNN